MSMELMVKAMKIRVGNPLRKLVLIKLADNASDQGECWPSYQHIADQCEISKRSVMNHIAALCESGLVKKVTRKGEKGNSSNIYLLHLDGAGDSLTFSGELTPCLVRLFWICSLTVITPNVPRITRRKTTRWRMTGQNVLRSLKVLPLVIPHTAAPVSMRGNTSPACVTS